VKHILEDIKSDSSLPSIMQQLYWTNVNQNETSMEGTNWENQTYMRGNTEIYLQEIDYEDKN
jgi:hypothetical protein